jgi:hypothetical protein
MGTTGAPGIKEQSRMTSGGLVCNFSFAWIDSLEMEKTALFLEVNVRTELVLFFLLSEMMLTILVIKIGFHKTEITIKFFQGPSNLFHFCY